jgi:hypothetical protein
MHGAANGRLIELITRAVPWPQNGEAGQVNLLWHFPDTFFHGQAVHTLDEFNGVVDSLAPGSSAYLSLSRVTALKGGNALALKSVWLHIPIKPEAHATANEAGEEAVKALYGFIKHYQLPLPSTYLRPGECLDVYWFSDRPLPIGEWRRYAEAMKAAALEFGLQCDVEATVELLLRPHMRLTWR